MHVVYDAGDIVCYAVSHDGGETWGDPVQIDAGRYPSIALDASGLPTIVYSRGYSTFCKMRRADGTWKEMAVQYGDAEHPNGPPAVARLWAVSPTTPAEAYCVLPVYGLNTNTSQVIMVTLDTLGAITTFLAETTGALADSFVSIGCTPGGPLYVAWQRADRVMCRIWDPTAPQRLEQVSAQPASHPFIEAYGDRVSSGATSSRVASSGPAASSGVLGTHSPFSPTTGTIRRARSAES